MEKLNDRIRVTESSVKPAATQCSPSSSRASTRSPKWGDIHTLCLPFNVCPLLRIEAA